MDDKNARIADLAHKINTPLTTMNGYIAMIAKNIGNKEKQDDINTWIESINSSIKKIADYAKEIQEISRQK
jgi:phosphoglycerate-specific signal transduction histidine kinase